MGKYIFDILARNRGSRRCCCFFQLAIVEAVGFMQKAIHGKVSRHLFQDIDVSCLSICRKSHSYYYLTSRLNFISDTGSPSAPGKEWVD